jgi:inorganic phosphate transporter, PiT family
MNFTLLILIILLAVIFDYINGFHDAANAITTIVSTKVLPPRVAVIYGATLNFVGALLGTQVAATIGKGIVDPHTVTFQVLLFALLGGILWNLITWYLGVPTSSSHALIGSLCGATVFSAGTNNIRTGLQHVQWHGLLNKVIFPMFSSPLLGFLLGYCFIVVIIWLIHRFALPLINRCSAKAQLFSAGFMALSHGSNDAQKSMGIIALAVSTFYKVPFKVELWIIVLCALAMGAGTLSGGWKIIRTLGSKMLKLQPIQGFAADTTAGTVILTASHFGIPVSTTHVISSAIMGVGASKRLSAVKWGIVGNILWAWLLTFPMTFLLSGSLCWLYSRLWPHS